MPQAGGCLFRAAAMRRLLLPSLFLLIAAPALADDTASVKPDDKTQPQLSSRQCGLSTPYNVLVDGGGIWLYRDAGTPEEIFFHDGELSVDRQVRAVSQADAQRLRQLEYQSRLLMPEVAGVARESVDIGFDALAGVVEVMSGSRRQAKRVEGYRKEALKQVDATLGVGRWDQETFDEAFEAQLEEAAEDMAASLGRSIMWTVLTGGAGRMEKRAEQLEATLEQSLELRARGLEARADGLCARVRAMDALQSELEFRYQGQPLRLLEIDRDAPKDSVVAEVPR